MSKEASIKVGESGEAFVKRNPGLVKTYQSIPNVVQDYSIKWTERPRGQVRIDHGQHSFTIRDVFSVISDEDLTGQFTQEGLFSVDITAGMSVPAPGTIPHAEAQKIIYEILRDISSAGWKTITPRSRPRLTGQTRLEYALSVSNSIRLEAAHTPTIEEWMRLENHSSWSFYADGLYIEVSFQRSLDPSDPKVFGVYLINLNIKSATEYFRSFAGPEKRDQWKEVVPGELAKVAKMRAEQEAELRAEGIAIDETYQDPPVPKFD